jgi:hypothetical protein
MMIRYCDRKFFIKDLADGTGTFLKIIKPVLLSGSCILSFGDSHIAITLDVENAKIIIKVLEGIRANEKLYME